MKKRYKNHINSLIKNSPIIGFSKEDVFNKGEIINSDQLCKLNEYSKLETISYKQVKYRSYEKQMYSDLVIFTDNYLLCGGHEFVYLLKPYENNYRVVEKESISEWVKKYWNKEDPGNKRDWCYFDEDTHDLYNYIMNCFNKCFKHKINTYK